MTLSRVPTISTLRGWNAARPEECTLLKLQLINGCVVNGERPVKSFPLRGIKDSPQYRHDGRLLTLEDAVSSST